MFQFLKSTAKVKRSSLCLSLPLNVRFSQKSASVLWLGDDDGGPGKLWCHDHLFFCANLHVACIFLEPGNCSTRRTYDHISKSASASVLLLLSPCSLAGMHKPSGGPVKQLPYFSPLKATQSQLPSRSSHLAGIAWQTLPSRLEVSLDGNKQRQKT